MSKPNHIAAWLAQRCKERVFWQFLQARFNVAIPSEQAAIELIRAICKVESRAHIESTPVALELFHEQIRKPFANYLHRAQFARHATAAQPQG
jgi:hypothetical protein